MRPQLAVLVVAGCVAAAGCAAGSGQADPARSSIPAQTAAPSDGSAESDDAGEADGAVEAALAYVASTDDLMAHSPVGRREIFRHIATAESATAQLESFEQAAADLAFTLDVPVERLLWVEAPISVSVADSTADAATVDVWTVSILGSAAAGSPQEVWRTVHVGLVHTPDGWLVDEATADAGPTPAANELALQSGFDEFERVAGWTPVVEGVGL
jgi:hypothetical protein